MIVRMSASQPDDHVAHELAEAVLEQLRVLAVLGVLDLPAPMAAMRSAVPRFGSRSRNTSQATNRPGSATITRPAASRQLRAERRRRARRRGRCRRGA